MRRHYYLQDLVPLALIDRRHHGKDKLRVGQHPTGIINRKGPRYNIFEERTCSAKKSSGWPEALIDSESRGINLNFKSGGFNASPDSVYIVSLSCLYVCQINHSIGIALNASEPIASVVLVW